MKITEVKTYSVKGRHWPRFPMVFVEIITDEGISGIGESLLYRSNGIVEAVHAMKGLLVGENPLDIERLWEKMYRQGNPLPSISGVEIALWDIMGKSLGVPVYQLLGGCCHDKVRVYTDGFFRGANYNPEEYIAKAKEAVDHGFNALKMDVDEPIRSAIGLNRSISLPDIQLTVDMVEAVREAVGYEVDLAIDAHGAFDVATAIRLGQKLEPFDLLWFEDPVPQLNIRAVKKVTDAVDVPICTGELLRTRYEFRELFETQAADIIMPDVARTGGLLELKKIAAMADTYYIPVAPHNMVGPVATIASLHLCASIPNFLVLEYQLNDVPWIDDLISSPVPIEEGYLNLPKVPGLGIELNMEEVERRKAD